MDNLDKTFDFGGGLLDAASAAQLLGVKPSRIKQLVRDRILVGFYKEGSWWVPVAVLVDLASPMGRQPGAAKMKDRLSASVRIDEDELPLPPATHVPLWTLSGTVTVLKDGGFSDGQILEWLFTPCDELGETPMDALIEGRHHLVNSVASALAW